MRFEERTEAEKGFAPIWDAEIAPSIAAYQQATARPIAIGKYGTLLLTILAVPGAIYHWLTGDFVPGTDDYKFYWPGVIVLYLIALLPIWWPLIKKMESFGDFLREAVSLHFERYFKRSDEAGIARALTATAIAEEIIERGGYHAHSNLYVGTYRDCALTFCNVAVSYYSGTSRTNRSESHYFLLQVSVPVAFEGSVRVRREKGRVLNYMRSMLSDHKQVKFDHEAFEKRYEVYADNEADARRLLNNAFLDNFMALSEIFGAPGLTNRAITGLFKDGQFMIAVPDDSDFLEGNLTSRSPQKVEAVTRTMIEKLSLIPRIVDYLHGERPADD